MTAPIHFKKGWDREKLAEYILSKFCFTAKPSTVSDDLGSDFFCTLFKMEKIGKYDYPYPLSSFAIQIKSQSNTTDYSANIRYLKKLEIPFFWGVLNEQTSQLSFYSGKHLQVFFSHVGVIKKLKIKPTKIPLDPYKPSEPRQEQYTVMFPYIFTIGVDSDRNEINQAVEHMNKDCSASLRHIAIRRTGLNIYEENYGEIRIMAGKDSAQQFRTNFVKCLAENFFNLQWLWQNNLIDYKNFIHEFHIYENIYKEIYDYYDYSEFIGFLTDRYNDVKQIISEHLS